MDDEKKVKLERGLEILQTVRDCCLHLPEVSESMDSFGHTTFRVKDKPFVMMSEKEEGTSIAIKTLPTTQDVLLQRDGFYKTPYIGQHGWVSLRTTENLDWEEIKELMIEGYLRTAPKKLAKLIK